MRRSALIAFLSICVLLAGAAYAVENDDKIGLTDAAQAMSLPRVPLEEVLDAVSRTSGKTYLVDARVHPAVVVGQPRARDITYPMLLKILRNNGLAAVSSGNVSSIVPVTTIRQFPLPLLYEDTDTIDGEEWVTRVVHLENANAAKMVPILRPLLPKQGHLAAHPESNTLVIVDRHANARRVARMIMEMDSSTPARTD